jgi:hypothetical protein
MSELASTVKKELSPKQSRIAQGLNKQGLTPSEARESRKRHNATKAFAKSNDLDFGILKTQTFFEMGGDLIPTGDFALVHTVSKECLNIVKGGYHVSQNHHIINLMLKGLEPFGGRVGNVMGGVLAGGKKVYLQVSIEGDSFIGNDTVKRYITIIDSNDGSTGLSVGIGDKTMSCSNQFFYFYKNGQAKFRHSASMAEKMKAIPSMIEVALSKSMKMQELYKEFASTPCSRDLAHKMVRKLVGYSQLSNPQDIAELSQRKLNEMNSLYVNIYGEMDGDESNGNAAKGENMWGLLSGVTRWTTHDKSAPRRDNGRLESIMIGTNNRTNMKAFDFVLEETGLVYN